jgi:Sugar-transfer associated ATP-grasp
LNLLRQKLRLRYGYHLAKFLLKELKSKVGIPLSKRVQLLREGFFSISYYYYDLGRNSATDYLTDYQRYVRAPLINKEFSFFLNNKMAFHVLLNPFPQYQVELVGAIEGGRILNADLVPVPDQWFWDQLRQRGRLVAKPVRGAAGSGVMILRSEACGIRLGRERGFPEEVLGRVKQLEDGIITEFVAQHPLVASFFPETTNTVRVLMLRDMDNGRPFVAAAILRVGSERSYPVDNWEKGGLSVPIDLGTGQLGTAVKLDPGGQELQRFATHPESGVRIEGVHLPFWSQVRDDLLEVCRTIPVLRYVGWDVIVTDHGFKILEGNSYSGVSSIQVHGPLLTNHAVRRFYDAHMKLLKPATPPRA